MIANRAAYKALHILNERRKVVDTLLDSCFAKQRAFIEDKADLKAVLCSRRAGKTVAAGISYIKTGTENPGCNMLYVGLTRESAKRTLCKDVMDILNKKFQLGLKFNKSSLTYTFPNGSILTILGLDCNPEEASKILGQKYKLVIIDEAGSFTQNLDLIINENLIPSMIDDLGTICIIGTPQHNKNTLFYRVTMGQEIGWKLHEWNTIDNPYMKANWEKRLKEIEETKPEYKNTASYKMMFLGQWVADEAGLVYKFNRERNICDNALYELNKDKTIHVLGVDLGYDDDTSFVVGNYSNYRPELIVPYVYKRKSMIITEVADMIKALDAKFNFTSIVIDGANKQAVQELIQRHSLSKIVTADKAGKVDFIELCNTDLVTKKILFTKDCEELFGEFESLIWDPKQLLKGIRVELASCPNHCCDGFLYMWRRCYNYVQLTIDKIVLPHTEEAVDAFWERESEKVMDIHKKPWWEM